VFACYGGDRFWPLTADVAVFHAPLDRTVRALRPRPRRRWWPRLRYPRHETLAAALAARTQHALLLVATNDRRTAVLSTAGLDHGWLRERAALDLRCDLVRTTFRPAGTDVDPAARFGDLRIEPAGGPGWSTIAELRAAYGYPATGVVTSLTGNRAPAEPTPPPG
jgi:hypothetical protein